MLTTHVILKPTGEVREVRLNRLMDSPEFVAAFPNDEQRKKAILNAGEDGWPKIYKCMFIEPGPAHYEEPLNSTILIEMPALDKMAPTFPGKPVVNRDHKDVTPETVCDGKAEGVVGRVWKEDGWWWCDFIVWDMDTQRNCESGKYFVSCAYEPTEVGEGGRYHNVEYQEEVLDGQYTHLAIVANPRYEGARIFVNSKGGRMNWKFWNKGKKNEGEGKDLDPSSHTVDVDGEDVGLDKLLEASLDMETVTDLENDTVIERDGKSFTVGELKENYRKMKNRKNADDDESDKKKKAEAKAAAKSAEEKKNMEDEAAEKEKKEKEDEEKKNAKEAVEKEKKEKDEEERKNSLSAKVKADEEAAKKSGAAAFDSLKNAQKKRGAGLKVPATIVTIGDRIEKGKTKYGSTH